ncbi:hypothetical protein AUEXF2481DRAFT_30733 [Aureobasidium subglaciale EXF-2481]|uniref:Protein BNI4 n=1 Tax=Aureobasidium subglaciale (strain EXF-2481) TaxID=1043005 RepID=A0A074YDT4_AURSE|nr:uncharacterized protein AUEXF2481DRAFT_30733 [Aureobasidium subglaciale EXF-2481]KAI5208306.1 hypothetical protein E4T38_02827 [Aureobasidium subglaciale]KAI5227214.1 hypothetical protein E4T40_02733 [Aureobasidium subglaciale]KAI5230561.1 hypothetical protein E4T41_02826 [Aureobasidium subglaciale]KAI5264968.1 hypothetical protein E4T46_02604 [Aureobasidium subglaciale]KEQ94194.1 hypothetical protein AUEXF2481DRAFT_30733 [Aureobasidium subglaciale EXF-2481]
MAEVLSPLPSPPSSINMLHSRPSSSDAYQANHQRVGSTPRTNYRSSPSAAPVQPYAFQTTPHLRQESRTISSSSNVPQTQQKGHKSTSSTSTTSSADLTSKTPPLSPGKDAFINLSSTIPDLSLTSFETTPKSSPNRYRRTPQRADSNHSLQKASSPASSVDNLLTPPAPQLNRTASDDITVTKSSTSESAKRYRRRSLNSLEMSKLDDGSQRPSSQGSATIRPVSFHSRTSSGDSTGRRVPSSSTPPPAESGRISPAASGSPVKLPIRGTATNPSPLSKSPITRTPQSPDEETPRRAPQSPAAQQLAHLSANDLNRGMRSRFRRAFSFGATQELRRSSENLPPQGPINPLDEMSPEQAAIARQQEAAGIGSSIYTGQGGFTGSTDNLSISSTASSASMMLRKMGKGMKKGGRSIKGLFRPKSVIGVPAADGPVQPSMAQVSMVTVEAERRNVNVNAHPAEQPSGGTGFPKLEKNSIDTARKSMDGRNDSMRKSIVGNDAERAEVLAAVKKGILKRAGTGSPMASPDLRPRDGTLSTDSHSPASSIPTTPRDERGSRSMSSTTSDYFNNRLGISAAKSMPNTPQGGSRNISFSPRIQFYDAWSASDYDRRGDIATCNRLTPMLAQQIKEELNTFKMEMEVHELSKPHTHFF